jgi:hypothetical protein
MPRAEIFMVEGFDLLGADPDNFATTPEEATAYLSFTGPAIDTAKADYAFLTTFVPSGNGPEGNLLFNDRLVASSVWDYGAASGTQVAVDSRDVRDYLHSSGNEAAIRSTLNGATPVMEASHAFLVVTYPMGGSTMTTTLSPTPTPTPALINQTANATGTPTQSPTVTALETPSQDIPGETALVGSTGLPDNAAGFVQDVSGNPSVSSGSGSESSPFSALASALSVGSAFLSAAISSSGTVAWSILRKLWQFWLP